MPLVGAWQLLGLFEEYFDIIEFGRMKECRESEKKFGVPFLWTTFWRKKF